MGVEYQYESYDHKMAVEELKQIETSGGNIPYGMNNLFEFPYDCFGIPDDIKQNHIVWRRGKLREISFNPRGEIFKVRIGNRRSKTFYLSDFGIRVKPIIMKDDDVWNLIGLGLAVEKQE